MPCPTCDGSSRVPFGVRWGLVGHTAPCPTCNPDALVNIDPPSQPYGGPRYHPVTQVPDLHAHLDPFNGYRHPDEE